MTTRGVESVVNGLGEGETRAETAEKASAVDPQEALLVRRAQGGDVRAFEALYRSSVGRVHALALRMTGDPPLAEEVTQDAFLRAWERIGTFEGRSRFSTWVHRLAVNRAIDVLRSRRLAVLESLDEGTAAALPGPAPSTEGWDLERAIASLPAGARAVFVLHDVEGFRHEEIATMTGMATGTSKAQLHRARKLLRTRLE